MTAFTEKGNENSLPQCLQVAHAADGGSEAAVRRTAAHMRRPSLRLPSLHLLDRLSHTISAHATDATATPRTSGATSFTLRSGERVLLLNSTLTCAPAANSAAQHRAEEGVVAVAEGRPHRRLMAAVAASAAGGASRRGSRGGAWDGGRAGIGLAGEMLGAAGVLMFV